jgi:hypothetical protein
VIVGEALCAAAAAVDEMRIKNKIRTADVKANEYNRSLVFIYPTRHL